MKKTFICALAALAGTALLASCDNFYKKTANGLLYKFDTVNVDSLQVQKGDLLVGELVFRFEDDTIFDNTGKPDRIIQAMEQPLYNGDVQEGLLMMHVGDKATFKVPADSVARYMQPNQMPQNYQSGKRQFFYYEITLNDIVTKDELAQEQANFMAEMEQRKNDEANVIQAYVAENSITAKPTQSGLYIIVNKKGTGEKVAVGKKVAVDYTGRLLDGTVFDSSREADAKESANYNDKRNYEPLTYVVGSQPMIKGWEEGIMGQPAGSEITLVMPSELAYGARGAGRDIKPYSPLTFNLTIVSVE